MASGLEYGVGLGLDPRLPMHTHTSHTCTHTHPSFGLGPAMTLKHTGHTRDSPKVTVRAEVEFLLLIFLKGSRFTSR